MGSGFLHKKGDKVGCNLIDIFYLFNCFIVNSNMSNIEKLRKSRNLTQKQLGKMVGLSGQAVLDWESKSYLPKTTTLMKLKEIFNVPIDYLLDYDDSELIEYIQGLIRNIPKEKLQELVNEFIGKLLIEAFKK